MASKLVACAIAFGVLAATPDAVNAQQGSPRFGDLVKPPAETPAGSSAAGCAGYNGETKTACEAYARAAFDHQVWALQYRERAYEAHHWYTMLVFILVCALVALGMCLSWREFNLDSRRREALIGQLTKRLKRMAGVKPEEGKPQAGEDAGAGTSTTLAIDPTGVKLTSPVLGVIILVVSMGFFYLYLKTVYPIQEYGLEPAVTQPVQNPPAKQ